LLKSGAESPRVIVPERFPELEAATPRDKAGRRSRFGR